MGTIGASIQVVSNTGLAMFKLNTKLNVKIIASSERRMSPVAMTIINPQRLAKPGIKELTLYHTIQTFTALEKKLSENIVGKGENAGN